MQFGEFAQFHKKKFGATSPLLRRALVRVMLLHLSGGRLIVVLTKGIIAFVKEPVED